MERECLAPLRYMALDKSPGIDGLLAESFVTFWAPTWSVSLMTATPPGNYVCRSVLELLRFFIKNAMCSTQLIGVHYVTLCRLQDRGQSIV